VQGDQRFARLHESASVAESADVEIGGFGETVPTTVTG
jgi:hypothetical protein